MSKRISGYARIGSPVPGEGPVLGLFHFRGDIFACRLTDGEPALYRMARGGWEIVVLPAEDDLRAVMAAGDAKA